MSRIAAGCTRIVAHRIFHTAVLVLIVANAAVVGLETSPFLMARFGPLLLAAGAVTQALFVVEIAVGWVRSGPGPTGSSATFATAGDPDLTLGELLAGRRYSAEFTARLILPMGAALWSTEPRRIEEFPALAFTRFLTRHALLDLRRRRVWRTVRGRAARYVEALTCDSPERLRLGARVTAVHRDPTGVDVEVAGAPRERFERVIIAAHSDEALALLADPTAEERSILGAIPYQENRATLHTDQRLLQRHRRAWASWSCFLPSTPADRVTVTYFMNRLQQLPTSGPSAATSAWAAPTARGCGRPMTS